MTLDLSNGEVTVVVPAGQLCAFCTELHDNPALKFEQLSDLAGIDYSAFGQDEWGTRKRGNGSFSRGVEAASAGRLVFGQDLEMADLDTPRFAVVYHLLSIAHNVRLRVRCFAPDDDMPMVPSVTGIWSVANWFEREAFDLYGILFEGHPDLRRILTDYGFVGHPFRKDFPLIGNVEMRFDPEQGRVVYEPVSIEPRVLVPRVIREDSRYATGEEPVLEEAAEALADGDEKPRDGGDKKNGAKQDKAGKS